MEKLMDTDPYNRAMPKKLIGEDMFGDTYPTCSTTCQKQTDCDDCPIQEAFARLRQYEQTGLNPEEIAELKGKRLIIAAELEEGMRLSTSILKQLCSTDQIRGEKKFKDPFDFFRILCSVKID